MCISGYDSTPDERHQVQALVGRCHHSSNITHDLSLEFTYNLTQLAISLSLYMCYVLKANRRIFG